MDRPWPCRMVLLLSEMSWAGPLEVDELMAMLSSPQSMVLLVMATLVEDQMSMPSVLGESDGELILILSIVTWLAAFIVMCTFGAFLRAMPVMLPVLTEPKSISAGRGDSGRPAAFS